MRLAEIFLMEPFQGGWAIWILAGIPVIALHQQILNAIYVSDLYFCGRQADGRREFHT